MDETDKKIIELLQQDGRLEDVEIARRTGSPTISLWLLFSLVYTGFITLVNK